MARISEWFAISSSSVAFCQNSSLWPVLLEWPCMVWLIASLSYASPLPWQGCDPWRGYTSVPFPNHPWTDFQLSSLSGANTSICLLFYEITCLLFTDTNKYLPTVLLIRLESWCLESYYFLMKDQDREMATGEIVTQSMGLSKLIEDDSQTSIHSS